MPDLTFLPSKPTPPLDGAKPFQIFPRWARESDNADARMCPAPKATSTAAAELRKLRLRDPAAFARRLTTSIAAGLAAVRRVQK